MTSDTTAAAAEVPSGASGPPPTPGEARERNRLIARQLAIGFLLALVAGIGFGMLADEVFEKPRILGVDVRAAALAARAVHPQLTTLMQVVSDCGKPMVLGILCLPVVIWLVRVKSHRRLLTFAATMIGGSALNTAIKLHFHRLRPAATLAHAPGYSFPSGHAMGSMLFYGSLAYVIYFTVQRRPALRRVAVALCFLLVLAVGASRVYLGVHYLTDVVGGWVAGFSWLAVCVWTTESWVHWNDRRVARRKLQTA